MLAEPRHTHMYRLVKPLFILFTGHVPKDSDADVVISSSVLTPIP
jgi:hypothetical protein